MPNPFFLQEISFEPLFTMQGLHANDRQARVLRQFDIDRYRVAHKALSDTGVAQSIYSTGKYGQTRWHTLNVAWLAKKGLNIANFKGAGCWFFSVDLYNKSKTGRTDPNGPRRLLFAMHWGEILHLLYTNTHYGDNGAPAFYYVKPPVLSPTIMAATPLTSDVASIVASYVGYDTVI